MLPKAFEVERLAVNQEPGSLHLYRAYAELLLIAVLPIADPRRIEIRGARIGIPELGIMDLYRPAASYSRFHDPSRCVKDLNRHHRRCPLHSGRNYSGLHLIMYNPVCPINIRHDRNIFYILCRGGIHPHRAVDASIVKEIEIWHILRRPPALCRLHTRHPGIIGSKKCRASLIAHRQCAVVYPIIHCNQKFCASFLGNIFCNLYLKGKKTAFVLCQEGPV